jgi:hypothetical protein
MIATSRRSASKPAISRRYEFSRLQDQTLASAYEALIPAISRRIEHPHLFGHAAQYPPARKLVRQSSTAGA